VMLRDADGRVVAANPAAEALLGLSNDQLYGRASMPADWDVLRSDGTPWPAEQVPDLVTLTTGVALRDQMLGVPRVGGGRRWLRVNTAAARDDREGAVQYVVSSLTDETPRHTALLAAGWERDSKRVRTQAVLDAGGPQIVVQPIVDLSSGAVVGGEALSRFSGQPAQGPDTWFADAADVGMGTELELAAVRSALEVLTLTPQDRYLSVNVSPATATSSAFFELLADAEALSRQLVLELTEHEGVSDYAALRTALAPLRARGVRLAVDDAGAGYASLSHILNLRPDIVKLDISLVRDIHEDPARRALVAGLLTFAQEIGACLVAEGIETAHELAALRAVGVTHGQGYYLGCPAPLPHDLVAVPQQAGPLQVVGR
jgi:EAL domain-containing protein (putative c-di-GMP-specific phosphodiesterase class I)